MAIDTHEAGEQVSAGGEHSGSRARARYPIGDGHHIIGVSAAMQWVYDTIDALSRRDGGTVLIQGPSGTGKELVARALHYRGPRAAGPFVAVNCGGIAPSLIESTLFGHVRGAFTGAVRQTQGIFRAAHRGTLFLDEVTEIAPSMQVKLLRAIQERTVIPVGSVSPIPVDIRLIAATNRRLLDALRQGHLREDLYYRLNVISISLPPLAERLEDIVPLVEHFLEAGARRRGTAPPVIPPETLQAFLDYDWPGNVREMENAIERAFILRPGRPYRVGHLPRAMLERLRAPSQMAVEAGVGAEDEAVIPTLEAVERALVIRALAATRGNKARAARLLAIDRQRLYRLIRRHGIGPPATGHGPVFRSDHDG